MFKRDKYHNCFKVVNEKSVEKAQKAKKNCILVKSSQEKFEDVVNMITIFGWEQQNIDLLKQNWFTLE